MKSLFIFATAGILVKPDPQMVAELTDVKRKELKLRQNDPDIYKKEKYEIVTERGGHSCETNKNVIQKEKVKRFVHKFIDEQSDILHTTESIIYDRCYKKACDEFTESVIEKCWPTDLSVRRVILICLALY